MRGSSARAKLAAMSVRPRPSAAVVHRAWLALALLCLAAAALLHWMAWDPLCLMALHAVPLPAARLSGPLWSSLSVLGLGWGLTIVVAAADRRDGRLLGAWLLALPLGALMTHLPKRLFPLPRPAALLPHDALLFIGEPIHGGGSMPSGHALAAFALLLLHVTLTRSTARRHAAVAVVAIGIAWSRLAVGAHWPSDVLVGAGLGLLTALLTLRLPSVDWLARRLAREGTQATIAGGELLAAAALLATDTGYPEGRAMQWLLAAVALTSAAARALTLLRRRAAAAVTGTA